MGRARTELIDCHDCGNAVSFSAAACPHCGSREPSGPYQPSPRERARFNIEGRNDDTGVVIAGIATALGALYGITLASGLWSAIGLALLCGGVGLLVGVPIAFAYNLTRWLVR